MPKKEVEIYSIDLIEKKELKIGQLVKQIIEQIRKVKGDFRQDEIIENWKSLSETYKDKQILIYKIKVRVSSGTYVRSIAYELGKKLKTEGLAFKIYRESMGDSNI